MARLGDIGKIITGNTPKTSETLNYSSNDICFIKPSDILDGEITVINDSEFYISNHARDKARILPPKCVLVTCIGIIGKVAINTVECAFNQQINAIVPDQSKCLTEYLAYAIQNKQKEMQDIANAPVVPILNKTQFSDIEISLPSIELQSQIVAKIGSIDKLISLRKGQLSKLDELVKSRFIELFGDPMTNSHGYSLKKYGDLFELNAGGTPSKQKPEYWENGTISWIGSNMCQNTVIYENDGNYITEEGLKHSSARMFPVDTVLIALVGATIGKTALLKFETTTNQNVLGVRGIRKNGYTPEFIFYYTQGLYQKFLNIGDGGFAMASKGFISELPIPLVDLTLQNQFATFVEQVDKSKLAIQKSLEKLETLKNSLMQKYFG